MSKRAALAVTALVLLLLWGQAPQERATPGQAEPLAVASASRACTSFCLDNDGRPVFGSNYDNRIWEGQLFVNKRNVAKIGWEAGTSGEYAQWVSRYGSVTFNLIGYQLAWAGMNEAGLVISTMALNRTENPPADQRPPLLSSFWLQYQLDNCSTIAEVIATDSVVRISDSVDHYLVCDATGECAVIEFLDGEMVCHSGQDLPVEALTNNTYAESLRRWKRPRLLKWLARWFNPRPPGDSLVRFETAANRVAGFLPGGAQGAVDYAFETLDAVSSSATQWSIVFDMDNREVHFRTKSNALLRHLHFEALDFSCRTAVRLMDVHAELWGEVSDDLVEHSHESNLAYLTQGLRRWGVHLPQERIDAWARHVDSFHCME